MELVILLTILFWAVIPGVITGWMFRERGWSMGLGLLLGILSGPLGILITLVLIFVSDRRSRGGRGKAFRVYYHFPVVGRLHVSTVWMLAGVATFLCVWALGGLWYEFQMARQNSPHIEKASGRAVAKTQAQQQLVPSNTPASAAQAETKTNAATQGNPTSSPSAPLLSSLASQPGQTAQATRRSDNLSTQASQPTALAASDSSDGATTGATSIVAPPAAPATAQPTASPQPTKPPAVSREAAVSEVTRGLSARGHNVHASVSGDAQTSTLSLSGATLTREAGKQVIGNRRVRESLKAAGVRIVVMINGQESWTYML